MTDKCEKCGIKADKDNSQEIWLREVGENNYGVSFNRLLCENCSNRLYDEYMDDDSEDEGIDYMNKHQKWFKEKPSDYG